MNRARLQAVLDVANSITEADYDGEFWHTCVIGHYCARNPDSPLKIEKVKEGWIFSVTKPVYKGYVGMKAVALYLDLTEQEVSSLFSFVNDLSDIRNRLQLLLEP